MAKKEYILTWSQRLKAIKILREELGISKTNKQLHLKRGNNNETRQKQK